MAYWDAGQARVAREAKDRKVELYVTARDAYISGNVVIGRAKTKGSHVPAYAEPPKAAKGLRQLLREMPGQVVRGDDMEFRN